MELLFWQKKHKANAAGKAPISMRITIHGQRSEYSTKIRLLPSEWNPKAGKCRGTSQASIDLNASLKSLEGRARTTLDQLLALATPDQVITAKDVRQAMMPNKPTPGVDPLVSELLSSVREQHYAAGNEATYRGHGSAIAVWKRWCTEHPVRLSQLTEAKTRSFAGWLAEHYAPTSAATWLNALRAMLNKGAPTLLPNPFNDLAPKNAADQAKSRTHLTREQLQQFRDLPLSSEKQQLARAVYLCQYHLHGCRISNVLELRWRDIDWQLGRVKFKAVKRGKYKDVALTEPLRQLLTPYLKVGSDLVFPLLPEDYFSLDKAGRWIARRNATARVNGRLVVIARHLGLSVSLHSHTARHTLAGHAGKVNKYTAQAMLGHRSIEQTEAYLESLSTAELDEAAAAIYDVL
ncbi:hypothetical protein BXP70_20420 [Hymenobacter crusticola]|uniref:Tyr recombinase domain-containing protein n=2 Tax=Hymenobacter crusticola TaxID=1770526 RepID=A0A243W999_9BACT|nr:hypothetical protein BXP70_20420 [Hymenobacter crusticola]